MIGIYKITSPSGRIYVGQTINIEKRKSYYQNNNCKNQQKLYHSLKKYGFNAHKFEVLCQCKRDELTRYEDFYIKKYNCIEKGLNLKGAGPHGKLSDDVKRRISIAHKGLKKRSGHHLTDEHKAKISKGNKGKRGTFKGRVHTDETKEKMSIANKGRQNFLGKKHTQETKKIMSMNRVGMKFTDEHKENLSKALKGNKIWAGKKHTEESIKKMSEVKKGKKASPETRRKMSESHKKRFNKTLSTAI